MDGGRKTFVHETELGLRDGTDSREPGGAVTVALCGHWEHEGPCRWPHNSAIMLEGTRARLRTVFVASPADEDVVRERIERGLRSAEGWRVVSAEPRPLAPGEEPLAQQLSHT